MRVKLFISKIQIFLFLKSSYRFFRQIELLLGQHASVIHHGQKQPFNEANLKLTEDMLEDIKGCKT
jgi:hypothetical protein